METREITTRRIQHFVPCPVCKEEIKGTSAKHLDSNMKTHLMLKHNDTVTKGGIKQKCHK